MIPPHVEYELTPLGHPLLKPVEALLGWTDANIEVCSAAQRAYDADA